MIRSMTGFGAASRETEGFRATVSVRSLNHRFLDLGVQLPRSLRALEPEVRARVQERLARGRVELAVQAAALGEEVEAVVASHALIAGLVRALREIGSRHGLEGGVGVSDIMRFPGALEVESPARLGERVRGDILALLDQALDGLEEMRRAEGRHLEVGIAAALDVIERQVARVHELTEQGKQQRRQALLEKLREVGSDLALDEGRVYQEVVRLVDRDDVSEETARVASHVAQARRLLAAEAACGKRLDFLAQELMREANTIGSKAVSAEVVHQVVELKSEVERLREQVQNVE